MNPRALVLMILPCIVGCASLTRRGDATLVDRKDIVWAMLDELRIPKISLANETTRTFKIRKLPVGILPTAFYIDVPFEEASKHTLNQPWRSAVVLIEAKSPNGKMIYTKIIDFSLHWKGASMPARGGRRKIWISGTDWRDNLARPDLKEYDLQIKVISHSRRPKDRLEVNFTTRVQGDDLSE